MNQREINWQPKKAKAQSPGFNSQNCAIWVQGHTAVIPAFSGGAKEILKHTASSRHAWGDGEGREGGEGGN